MALTLYRNGSWAAQIDRWSAFGEERSRPCGECRGARDRHAPRRTPSAESVKTPDM
jgi:hypothetical protein